jgi:hypothetical protein
MRLTPAQIEQTSRQLEAKPVPENSRMAPDLNRLFGEHTFFLGRAGLHIVEPAEAADTGAATGRLIEVASWTDSDHTSLTAHEPRPTDVIVQFDEAA